MTPARTSNYRAVRDRLDAVAEHNRTLAAISPDDERVEIIVTLLDIANQLCTIVIELDERGV
jgi:hypothetical protein